MPTAWCDKVMWASVRHTIKNGTASAAATPPFFDHAMTPPTNNLMIYIYIYSRICLILHLKGIRRK